MRRPLLLLIFQLPILLLFSGYVSGKMTNNANTQPSKRLEKPLQTMVSQPIIHQIQRHVDQRNLNTTLFSRALKSNNIQIQQAALVGLGRIGGLKIIPFVSPFLSHDTEKLRLSAAFALGICQEKSAAKYLWQRLPKEMSHLVKKEIYLGLGSLGEDQLVTKMLQRLPKENNALSIAALFQGLSIALVFHKDLKDDYSKIDYQHLLKRFSNGDEKSALIGYFLDKVPGIEKYINAEQLLQVSQQKLSPMASNYLARLIARVSIHSHKDNRALLAWLIEKSESANLSTALESTRALKNYFDLPQALVQIGKLQASSNPIVAQTALKVIADSNLTTPHVIKLLKKQLKNDNPAMVIEAMSGLIKRQSKEDMSWIVTFLQHKNAYIKIRLICLLKEKSDTEFNNLIQFFTQDPNPQVARYAANIILPNQPSNQNTPASSPSYAEALKTINAIVTLKTTLGEIKIKLLPDSPFTSWHFINSIKQGYLTNSIFNRVIGNFVAQGGDIAGDGTGSSNKTIREEINFLAHEPMTVGMATEGKDTATSEFFINTARNFHLDRNYTIFGRVIEGQNIVMKMTNGTGIQSIQVER